jgi:hypothetical protein
LHNGVQNGQDLLDYCDRNKWILMPPHSVFHTLSTLTLSELESVGNKLGVALDGTKKERVAKLARCKLRSRLQKVEGTLTENS